MVYVVVKATTQGSVLLRYISFEIVNLLSLLCLIYSIFLQSEESRKRRRLNMEQAAQEQAIEDVSSTAPPATQA